jgi:hypothetical protein
VPLDVSFPVAIWSVLRPLIAAARLGGVGFETDGTEVVPRGQADVGFQRFS